MNGGGDKLVGFDARMQTRFVYGAGAIDRLGELVANYSPKSILMVSDPGVISAGHTERAIKSLKEKRFHVTIFDGVIQNPTTREVDACLAVAQECNADLIIGIGGGSTMDTAKGCNFLYTNGGRMQDYWGVGKATKPMLPLVLVPTTAGTGSEAQSFALIADAETHQKMACGDHKAAATITILDPLLTLTQPPEVTALTGIDAIAHALESSVSTRRNELSSLYSRESFRLTFGNLRKVLQNPNDINARGNMLLGACYAGMAIENSMLGAAHALANPLTATYGVTHGLAVGMMLPEVLRYNSAENECADTYQNLAASVLVDNATSAEDRDTEWIIRGINDIMMMSGMEVRFQTYEVSSKDVPELAAEAAKQWTGTFNPRPLEQSDFELLYHKSLDTSAMALNSD
jgi:alcohol dehydrogenase